jgi:hypothetical protein
LASRSTSSLGIRLFLGGTLYDPTDPMGKMFFNILSPSSRSTCCAWPTREGVAFARARG